MNSMLFDIGATKTRLAFSDNKESFEDPKVWETSKEYEEGLKLFIENIKELAQGREIKTICGGMSRSIANWKEEKFKKDLEEAFGTEVSIENDAAMAGLGEANFGAGRGFEIVSYITVSTGVGGARIVNGKIDEHAIGFEPGKQIMNIETGETLENIISGRALTEKTGRHPKDISDENVWTDLAQKLAAGLNNIIVEWSPDCVVLGGSMITGNPSIPIEETEAHLKNILKIFSEIPPIKKAELGDFGGLYGALSLVKKLEAM